MKKIIILFIVYTNISYSQNVAKFISFDRSYYNNENILSSYTDKLNMEYNFKNKITLKTGFSMMNLNLLELENYDNVSIQSLYAIDLNIDKKIILKKGWTINVALNPQLRSNFITSVNSNDFIINGSLDVKKEFKNKSIVIFSVKHGTNFGKPRPYLEFSYSRYLSNKIFISVGFPKTFAEYSINKSHSFILQSNYEGYYTRLGHDSYSRVLENQILNYNSLFISRINSAFIYKYKFSDNSVVDFSLGRSFRNQFEIDESNGQTTKKQFNNSFTISMGFKYNLNFK